jgi:hypothetical protein
MDVATLAIKVENGEVVQAITSLDGLTVAGTKTEIATQRLSRRMGLAEIAARQMDAELGRQGRTMALLQIEAQKMDQEFGQTSRAMGLIEIEARKMDAAMQATTHAIEHGTESHEPHIHGLSRIGNSLATLVGHATGVPPVIEKIADALAITTFGHLATVGVLAGFAAVAFAYEKITEKAREAAKEVEETQAKIAKAANEGQTSPIRDAARRLQFGEPFDKEHKLVPRSEYAPGAFEGSLADLQGKLRALQERFYATTNGFTQLQIQQQIIGVKRSLAPMEKLMVEMQAASANVASQPGENAGTLNPITTEALSPDAIKKARKKAEKDAADEAERIWKAALEQRAEEANVGIRAQRDAYKAASEQSVRDFETAQDEETAIALQQQNEQARNAKASYEKQTQDAIHEFEAQRKYADDMHKEWLRGIEHMLTRGLTSFSSFLDSVFALFSRLMARMEQEQRTGGMAYKALGIGASAIGGGVAGYQIGQEMYSTSHGGAGNYARGAIGGAAAGAMIGSQILPGIGTAVGAIAGFVGGIIGVSNAAKEAARQMREMQTAVTLSMAELRAVVAKDPLALAIAQVEADREARRKAIEDAYQGGGAGSEQVKKRIAALNEMNSLEDQRIAQLKNEAAAAKEVSSAGLNLVQGYKLQAAIFEAMSVGGGQLTPPSSRTSSASSQTVVIENVTVLDGEVVARSAKKVYKRQAQLAFGDETRWAEVLQ